MSRRIVKPKTDKSNISVKLVRKSTDEVDYALANITGATIAIEEAEAVVEAATEVRRLRRKANMTQNKLAIELGVSQARISAIERGKSRRGPTYALLRRIARACGEPDGFVNRGSTYTDNKNILPTEKPFDFSSLGLQLAGVFNRFRSTLTGGQQNLDWLSNVLNLQNPTPEQTETHLWDKTAQPSFGEPLIGQDRQLGMLEHIPDKQKMQRNVVVTIAFNRTLALHLPHLGHAFLVPQQPSETCVYLSLGIEAKKNFYGGILVVPSDSDNNELLYNVKRVFGRNANIEATENKDFTGGSIAGIDE